MSMGILSNFSLRDRTSLSFILDYFLINILGLVFFPFKKSVFFINMFNPPSNSSCTKSHLTANLSQSFFLLVKFSYLFFIFSRVPQKFIFFQQPCWFLHNLFILYSVPILRVYKFISLVQFKFFDGEEYPILVSKKKVFTSKGFLENCFKIIEKQVVPFLKVAQESCFYNF